MISQLYSNRVIIPQLDRLPQDVHGIICEYLNKEHEFAAWRIMNEQINNIPYDIKLFACNNCSNNIYTYDDMSLTQLDVMFMNKLAMNMSNIIEVRKLVPLFYKTSKRNIVTSTTDDYVLLNTILREGYSVKTKEKYYTDYKVFRLNTQPTLQELSPVDVLFAWLLSPIKYHILYDHSTMTVDVQFEIMFREPTIDKLIRYVRKKKIYQ